MYTYQKIVGESHAFAKFIGKCLLKKKMPTLLLIGHLSNNCVLFKGEICTLKTNLC